MNYTISLWGRPQLVSTSTQRTYTVRFKICSDDSDALDPASIRNSNIQYLDEDDNPVDMIPSSYNLAAYQLPNEVDFAPLTGFSSGDMVDPSPEDFDEYREFYAQSADVDKCLCCRIYTATYTAEIINGTTSPDEVLNTCPEITIDPHVTQNRLRKAQFGGFYEVGAVPDSEIPGGCCESGFRLYATDNLDTGDDACWIAAEDSRQACKNVAFTAWQAALSLCDGDLACAEQAYSNYQTALENCDAAYETAIAACTGTLPCWPMISGQCMTPRSPNGSTVEFFEEKTEKVWRIRLYANDPISEEIEDFEQKTNCTPWCVFIPCRRLYRCFEANTVKLEYVRENTVEINGVQLWQREFQFHYKPDGWDEFMPIEGLDRAVCEGAPEGTYFQSPTGECVAGQWSPDDCVNDCGNVPQKAAITDGVGNAIREPMPLDLNGQPLCSDASTYFARWKTRCCADFNLLPLNNLPYPDEVCDEVNIDDLTGEPIYTPPATCGVDQTGQSYSLYCYNLSTTFVWTCDGTNWIYQP